MVKLGNNLFFVEEDSPEWVTMWRYFGPSFEAQADEDPGSGEVWQYMRTEWHTDIPGSAGTWAHCFRHRCHPTTGRREYRLVAPHPDVQRQGPKSPRCLKASEVAL